MVRILLVFSILRKAKSTLLTKSLSCLVNIGAMALVYSSPKLSICILVTFGPNIPESTNAFLSSSLESFQIRILCSKTLSVSIFSTPGNTLVPSRWGV